MQVNGTFEQRVDGTWVCRFANGKLAKNQLLMLPFNGTFGSYYFDADGNMATGWVDFNNSRYYMNPASDGTMGMSMRGWRFIDGFWYYFSLEDGRMATGWLDWNGKQYYLNPDAASNELPYGALYTNALTPDGRTANENGEVY